jgi:hypothetical protein
MVIVVDSVGDGGPEYSMAAAVSQKGKNADSRDRAGCYCVSGTWPRAEHVAIQSVITQSLFDVSDGRYR